MRVSSDLEAICGKCGEVWHVVIAKTNGRIAKVECKQCGARHRYRPVDGAAAGGPKGPTVRKAGRRTLPPPAVLADPSRPPRAFDPGETYQVGDRVVHTSFGEGVVQVVAGATKIRVLFDAGAKTLVQGRRGA